MFNERDAIRLRLAQLMETEERIMKEIREERREIMNRLRELDSMDSGKEIASHRDLPQRKYSLEEYALREAGDEGKKNALETDSKQDEEEIPKGYHKKTLILRDATLNILKKHTTAVPLMQIKKEIESATGVSIKNISLFMTNLAKKEKNLKKATHGQYMYVEK
ncbi:hypothetical protein V1498_15885 [Peribacillus sp. SCS-26]|uniref:Rok-like winged helix domain-containing protein n=1 Tax=Paraperibacillus marinus TaxID=3115295 RepID=UPI0039060692